MAWHWLSDGVPLWYEDHGAGRPLVLLQGLQFPAGYFWQKNLAALVEAGNRVIVLDLRGQGLSGKPSGDHSVARNAADLAEFLDGRDITGAMLLGVAFGGIVALEYLRSHPAHRLRALGLCEMSPRVMSDEGWEHPTFGDFPPEAARGYGAGVRADRALLDGFLDAAFADPLDPAIKAEMKAQMYLTPTETVATIIDDMVEPDFRAFLPEIALPTLLVYGRRNNPVMPGRVGAWMAGRIPAAELVELDGGGHSVFWEDPTGFNRAVADFASRH
ncbi:alpha/beta fold hydrolase [Novosphingobium sp. Gsoil 351]|uniref:alpha/beta fold hydrolase n=1 Tax=Novosphingobium sp. Gsoil 351 TaxID=2675225 RepID=UPI0012B48DB8|nr:alpha/beta hydrolase [Novosphingobium sp. Gsoil 351]QGN55823.1 alpha/beta fold hydrolase [Novosphingobium sp. Gsoil 351]